MIERDHGETKISTVERYQSWVATSSEGRFAEDPEESMIENIENAEENRNMGDATIMKVPVPVFKDNYEQYANKIKIWDKVCGLKEDQKASVLWLNLPNDHPSDINDKIYK